MKILDKTIRKDDLAESGVVFDGPMVKAVVDVGKGLLAVDADLEGMLLQYGSNQDHLWGINLWFEDEGEDFIEFDSVINVRPRQGNHSRDVEDKTVRDQIVRVIEKWIQ